MAGILTDFILSFFKGQDPNTVDIKIKSCPVHITSKYKPVSGIDTRKFEGLRLHVYKDTVGKSTIGYGHNLQGGNDRHINQLGLNKNLLINGSRDLTLQEANDLFDLDYENALNDAKKLCPRLDSMPQVIKYVLGDLSFNMGYTTLSTFKRTLAAFNEGRWDDAADALKVSKWYIQTGNRGRTIVNALYNIDD